LVSRGVRLRKRREEKARKMVKRDCKCERAWKVNVAGNKAMCAEIKS
jgi:hypothetical protein